MSNTATFGITGNGIPLGQAIRSNSGQWELRLANDGHLRLIDTAAGTVRHDYGGGAGAAEFNQTIAPGHFILGIMGPGFPTVDVTGDLGAAPASVRIEDDGSWGVFDAAGSQLRSPFAPEPLAPDSRRFETGATGVAAGDVSGTASLTLFRDGRFEFEWTVRESSPLFGHKYAIGIAVNARLANGQAIAAVGEGHVGPLVTLGGGQRSDSGRKTGTNPLIADNWAVLSTAQSVTNLQASTNVADFVAEALAGALVLTIGTLIIVL